jgi:hypothetical protein
MTTFSVTKDGKILALSLYTWNEKAKTFSTNENGLVLDFTGVDGVTFKTSDKCTFNTGSFCTFKTGSDCIFNTGFKCTFKTGSECTFNTSHSCTFNIGSHCTFKTGSNCIFEVGVNCCLIRYDVRGVTEIPAYKKIKLNDHGMAGYIFMEEKKETPTCNGKVVEIDGKQYKLTEIKK